MLYLSSEYLLNFLSNFYIPSCVEKHSDLWSWNSLKKHWFKALLLTSLSTQNSSQCPCYYTLGRRKLLISPGRTLLKICSLNSEGNRFSKEFWLGKWVISFVGFGRNYDFLIKIQSENMKMTWNIILFIYFLICSFSKRDGVTVL